MAPDIPREIHSSAIGGVLVVPAGKAGSLLDRMEPLAVRGLVSAEAQEKDDAQTAEQQGGGLGDDGSCNHDVVEEQMMTRVAGVEAKAKQGISGKGGSCVLIDEAGSTVPSAGSCDASAGDKRH